MAEAFFSAYIKAGQPVPEHLVMRFCGPSTVSTVPGVPPTAASAPATAAAPSTTTADAASAPAAPSTAAAAVTSSFVLRAFPGDLGARSLNSVVAGSSVGLVIQEHAREFMKRVFENRTEAHTAAQMLSTRQGRKGMQDSSVSGKDSFTVICSSSIVTYTVPKLDKEGRGILDSSKKPVLVRKTRRVDPPPCAFSFKMNKHLASSTWSCSKSTQAENLFHNPMCSTRQKASSGEIKLVLGQVIAGNRTISGKALVGDERSSGFLPGDAASQGENTAAYARVMRAAREVKNGSEQEYSKEFSKIPEYVKQVSHSFSSWFFPFPSQCSGALFWFWFSFLSLFSFLLFFSFFFSFFFFSFFFSFFSFFFFFFFFFFLFFFFSF